MTTEIHFVKNNPFILNDYHRYNSSNNSRIPTSASSHHIPSNFRSNNFQQTASSPPVIQSASCSNIQRTVVMSRFDDPSAQPPIPHSIFRKFRLVSEQEAVDDTTIMPQNRQNYNTMNSTSTTAISTVNGSSAHDWSNNYRGRLEHSQSHGAISQFQQPLKLQVDDDNNNLRGGHYEEEDDGGKNCKF